MTLVRTTLDKRVGIVVGIVEIIPFDTVPPKVEFDKAVSYKRDTFNS